jgi:hypothetical protein
MEQYNEEQIKKMNDDLDISRKSILNSLSHSHLIYTVEVDDTHLYQITKEISEFVFLSLKSKDQL